MNELSDWTGPETISSGCAAGTERCDYGGQEFVKTPGIYWNGGTHCHYLRSQNDFICFSFLSSKIIFAPLLIAKTGYSDKMYTHTLFFFSRFPHLNLRFPPRSFSFACSLHSSISNRAL